KRTPDRERKQYASRAIRLRFDPNARDGASSRSAVRREAERLASEIEKGKRNFSDVLHQRCCPSSERSEEGRDNLAANDVLDRLRFGEVSAHPLEWDLQFLILQRVHPGTVAPLQPTLLDLSSPSRPDVEYFIVRAPPPAAQLWMRLVAQDFSSNSGGAALPGAVRQHLAEIHDAWEAFPDGAALELRRSAF